MDKTEKQIVDVFSLYYIYFKSYWENPDHPWYTECLSCPGYRDVFHSPLLRRSLRSPFFLPLPCPATKCKRARMCMEWGETRAKRRRKSTGTVPHKDDLEFTQPLDLAVFAFQQTICKGKPFHFQMYRRGRIFPHLRMIVLDITQKTKLSFHWVGLLSVLTFSGE